MILLLPLLLASCVTSRKVNLLQEAGKHGVPTYADTLTYEDYNIRIGDRLYVYVYSIDERVSSMFNASGHGGVNSSQIRQGAGAYGSYDLYTYLVLEDGTIDYPLVGKIPVRGKTTREVKAALEHSLMEYVQDQTDYKLLSVEVNIVRGTFSVISDHGSGMFAMPKEKVTIFEALAIVREIEGETKVMTFDVRSEEIINSEYYYIEPNDVIYIQRIKGQSFGINSVTTTISVVATTLAFGGFVYGLVVRIMNTVENHK